MRRILALLLLSSMAVAVPSALPAQAASVPRLTVKVVASGLDHPWDVATLPGSRGLLVTERDRATLSLIRGGHRRAVTLRGASIWHGSETGLMGLEVDPRFTKNRRIYTCQGWNVGSGHDVRVVAWRLNKRLTAARLVRTLVAGLPSTSGRHGGCRLLITRNGSLLVGTGDAATGTNPRDLTSLGGKVLRINRMTGAPAKGNPFRSSPDPHTRLIYTYGHRNVQGLVQRGNGSLWSVEQGTSRDDEVNLLTPGGDYGYNPVPGYNESVPMTDQALPGTQIDARWSSGPSTIATSGATFVPRKRKWGAYAGALAVSVLKGNELMLLSFDRAGRLTSRRDVLTTYGRIRTAAVDHRGNLLVTTDNGSGRDVLLRVVPRR